MNLYLLTQTVHTGYDTFDSCVVAAESAERAKLMHPGGAKWEKAPDWVDEEMCWIESGGFDKSGYDWAMPSQVTVTLIGLAESGPERVICASFRAG